VKRHRLPTPLSALEARRIALTAQGFGKRSAKSTLRHVRGVFDDVHVIQVDSVNAICRSQELVLWARRNRTEIDPVATIGLERSSAPAWHIAVSGPSTRREAS